MLLSVRVEFPAGSPELKHHTSRLFPIIRVLLVNTNTIKALVLHKANKRLCGDSTSGLGGGGRSEVSRPYPAANREHNLAFTVVLLIYLPHAVVCVASTLIPSYEPLNQSFLSGDR